MEGTNREAVNAFIEAYGIYYPLVFGAVYSKLCDVDDAKDACQEVFMRLFNGFDGVRDVRKWLYGTLRNVTLEFIKKKKPDFMGSLEDLDMAYVNGFRDTRLMIMDAMKELENFYNEKERVLFDLIAIYNFCYKDAGAHTGMSESKAKYRYGLMVRKLIHHFKEKGINSLEELL